MGVLGHPNRKEIDPEHFDCSSVVHNARGCVDADVQSIHKYLMTLNESKRVKIGEEFKERILGATLFIVRRPDGITVANRRGNGAFVLPGCVNLIWLPREPIKQYHSSTVISTAKALAVVFCHVRFCITHVIHHRTEKEKPLQAKPIPPTNPKSDLAAI